VSSRKQNSELDVGSDQVFRCTPPPKYPLPAADRPPKKQIKNYRPTVDDPGSYDMYIHACACCRMLMTATVYQLLVLVRDVIMSVLHYLYFAANALAHILHTGKMPDQVVSGQGLAETWPHATRQDHSCDPVCPAPCPCAPPSVTAVPTQACQDRPLQVINFQPQPPPLPPPPPLFQTAPNQL